MTDTGATDRGASRTGRRTFLKTVGAAGTAAVLSYAAGADRVDHVIGDGLNPSSDRLQEAMIVFSDGEDVDRLEGVDLAKGYLGFETLPLAYAELDGEQIREIAGWSSVVRVVDNRTADLDNDDSQDDTNAREVWESEEFGYTGENVHAALIDTGLDAKHPGHLENVDSNYQWIGNPLEGDVVWEDVAPGNNDELGHGTHCAGSITGDGDGSLDADYAGMAPDARITSYGAPINSLTRVMRAAAYDHVIAGNRDGIHDIRIVSNSWTWGDEYDPWHPIPVAIFEAFEAGIVTLFSAGNDGPDPETLNETKDPFALSVAATDADMAITDFSSRGVPGGEHDRRTTLGNVTRLYEEGLDVDDVGGAIELERPGVAAKGGDVMSTQAVEQAFYALGALPVEVPPGEQTTEPLYGTLSGTSMSCPTTAGVVALFLDAYYEEHGEFPHPIDTINTMEATAREAAHESYNRINVGAGYVDARAAVEAALNVDGLPPGLEELPPGREEAPPGWEHRDDGLPGFDDVELAEPYPAGSEADGPPREPDEDDPTEEVDGESFSGEMLAGAGGPAGVHEDSHTFTTDFEDTDLEWTLLDARVEVDGPPGFEWTELEIEHRRDGEWVTIGAQQFQAPEGEIRVVEGWMEANPGAEAPAVVDDEEEYRVTIRAATEIDSAVTYEVDVAFVAFDVDS